MKRTLDVYLHEKLTGHLFQDAHGELGFAYAEPWLHSQAAQPLSHSLPLRAEPFSRRECRGFFAGILPEEGKRLLIAKNLGISGRNDFAMLEQIGGECAGAVTFITAGQVLPNRKEDHYRRLSEGELAAILRELPRRPLLAGEDGIRLSLAGAQDKIAVQVSNGVISIPLDGAPSTHILKPAIEHFEGLVYNEALCMKLARAVGLKVAEVEIGRAEDIDYLLVKRYDRYESAETPGEPAKLQREHQEDFCQALNVPPENKYQNEDGPSLKQCFELLRSVSSLAVRDLQGLLDAVIFNYLIGNHDAHGKNFSLLYSSENRPGRTTRLAPLYDLLSTVYYPQLSPKMAMKMGGEYRSDRLRPSHFETFAEEAGLSKALVRKRVVELAGLLKAALAEVPREHPVTEGVARIIESRCLGAVGMFGKS